VSSDAISGFVRMIEEEDALEEDDVICYSSFALRKAVI
jgi:hypothetical protein